MDLPVQLQSLNFGLQARDEQVPATWRLLGYGGGLLTAAGAIGLGIWLRALGAEHHPFLVFSLAIVLSGWLFGLGPSVVTALVCGLAAMLFLRLNVLATEGVVGLSLYMLTSLGICLIVGQQRHTRLVLERTVRELNGAKEQAERAKEAAERANEAKEQFLHIMSHELRNPLQSITMSTHILRQDLSNSNSVSPRFRRIDLAVQALGDMIDDLVDSTRIATGQLRLDCQSMDLVDAVRSAIEMMAPIAEDKQIKLLTDITLVDLPIIGDPERLRECICNLLGNAIKFSAKGGGDVRVSLRQTRLGAEVRVTDQGDGIDPEFLPRVFERFTQSGPSTQRRGGLGLGLSIVKHLVELHSGTITAESAGKGRGASFTILLPNTFLAA